MHRKAQRIGDDVCLPSKAEDGKQIRTLLRQIAKDNDCMSTFAIGETFGELVYWLDEFEAYVLNVELEALQYFAELHQEEESRFEEAERNLEADFDRWMKQHITKLFQSCSGLGKDAIEEIVATWEA